MRKVIPSSIACAPALSAGAALLLLSIALPWSVARAQGAAGQKPSSSWAQRLGQPQARLLAKYCDRAVMVRLQRSIPAASDEFLAPLRTALAAFAKADEQAHTKPTRNAVESHVVGLGKVAAALLAAPGGLRVSSAPMGGSQRGTLNRVIVEDSTGNTGFQIITGGQLTSITMSGGQSLGLGKIYGLGVDGSKITRLLNPKGTAQVSESAGPNNRIVYSYDKFTVDESNLPTHWRCFKCFVGPEGKALKTRYTFSTVESSTSVNSTVEESYLRKLQDVDVRLPR